MLHNTLAMVVIGLSLWLIISPRIPTGVFGTAGLCAVAVSALWSMDVFYSARGALQIAHIGFVSIGGGIAVRSLLHRGSKMRRMNDWRPEFDHTHPPKQIDRRAQRHVAGGKGGS